MLIKIKSLLSETTNPENPKRKHDIAPEGYLGINIPATSIQTKSLIVLYDYLALLEMYL